MPCGAWPSRQHDGLPGKAYGHSFVCGIHRLAASFNADSSWFLARFGMLQADNNTPVPYVKAVCDRTFLKKYGTTTPTVAISYLPIEKVCVVTMCVHMCVCFADSVMTTL